MEDFHIQKTFNTPEVYFSASDGILKIEGRSIPEDPGDIYEKLIEVLKVYFENAKELTRIDIKLEYINSGSSKYLLEMLRLIKNKYDDGNDVIVNWYYEEDDESIYELGHHYQNTVQVPFKLIDYY